MVSKFLFLSLTIVSYLDINVTGFDERCIKVPLKNNFDINKVGGHWYTQDVGDEEEGSRKCLNFMFTIEKLKNATKDINIERLYTSRNTTDSIKLYQINDTSVFDVKYFRGARRNTWLIDIDYDSWSTWYACLPEENDKGILYIVSREKYPSKATMEKAYESARNVGFKLVPPYLKHVDQNNCN